MQNIYLSCETISTVRLFHYNVTYIWAKLAALEKTNAVMRYTYVWQLCAISYELEINNWGLLIRYDDDFHH